MFGIVNLFCPICAIFFRYNEAKGTYTDDTFGILCSRMCHKKAQEKYARMILGKDDE